MIRLILLPHGHLMVGSGTIRMHFRPSTPCVPSTHMSLIEEIDSPTLCDKHPEVQGATWTSVRDLALVPWSPAAHALLPVRTGPPFETFQNGFVAAWTAQKNNFGPSSWLAIDM